jgi:hypothetical protein
MVIPCVPGAPTAPIRALFPPRWGGKPTLANETGRFGVPCLALGFALGQFLLFLLLFFLGPCARRPVSLRSISTVVWLECHRILLCAG